MLSMSGFLLVLFGWIFFFFGFVLPSTYPSNSLYLFNEQSHSLIVEGRINVFSTCRGHQLCLHVVEKFNIL